MRDRLVQLDEIVQKFGVLGPGAYIVGGAPRDVLLGLAPGDYDIVCRHSPGEIEEILRASGMSSINVNPKDGLVSVALPDGTNVDITSYDVDIEKDLASRDFVLNSMAYGIGDMALLDPFGAQLDLSRETIYIRTTTRPTDVFGADPLRMLRLFSLLAKIDCSGRPWAIEGEVLVAIHELAEAIRAVPGERIFQELRKIVLGKYPNRYFSIMLECGLLRHVIPELARLVDVPKCKWHVKDAFNHTLDVVSSVPPVEEVRWAALFHDLGKATCVSFDGSDYHYYGHAADSAAMVCDIFTRLRASNFIMQRVRKLVEEHMFQVPTTKAGARRLVHRIGEDLVFHLLNLYLADKFSSAVSQYNKVMELTKTIADVIADKEPVGRGNLAIDGDIVMEVLGIPPGPEVGRCLSILMDIVLEDPGMNTPEKLKSYLLDMSRSR